MVVPDLVPPVIGLRRLPSQPVVHFVLLGAALFAGYAIVSPKAKPGRWKIVVTRDDVARIREEYVKLMGRPPTDAETRGLLSRWVDDEVRYREALALGLDQDDPVVRARLAQKLQFLTEDTTPIRQPMDAELAALLASDGRYVVPATVSFRHVFFSHDRRGAHASADAVAARDALSRGADDAATQGDDVFPAGAAFAHRSADDLDGIFGAGFGKAVLALPPGAWRGPIESSYGSHIVWVVANEPARRHSLAEVRARLVEDWVARERERASRAAFQKMRAHYTVELPP